MCENIVEFICESESLEQACLVLSASKKRTFVAVQISPAVRVSIGEYFGLYRGEDAVGKVVSALTVLGADVVVDSSIAFDAVTLMRANALQQAKETGVGLPLFSSECTKWVEFAKAEYPEIASAFLPSATSLCAKALKKYYGEQMPDKKVRVIALEMGPAKKAEPGVDVVLTLDELAQLLDASELNVRMMPKVALETPFGVGSGASYFSAVSGGDAEALARCLVKDKTQNSLRKFAYSGLYDHKARRDVELNLDGTAWNFAVVDSLDEAAAVIADVKSGAKAYDYVEVTACAGGQIGFGCDLSTDEGEMTRRLRKLGLQYLDFARAARSADSSSAAAVLVKEWNAMCRSGEAAAFDVIDEIVEDYDEPEVIEEPVIEEEPVVEEEVVEEAPVVEEAVEEAPVEEPVVEEVVEEAPVEEPVVEEVVEEAPAEEPVVEEVVEEAPVEEPVVEEVVEETPIEEPVVEEEVVEEAPGEEPVVEDVVEEPIEEPVVEEVVEEPVEEPVVEEVVEEPAPVSKEEIEAEMCHVEELLAVPMSELTPAQKAARNIYYRRLSTRERHKLKRLKKNQKKN